MKNVIVFAIVFCHVLNAQFNIDVDLTDQIIYPGLFSAYSGHFNDVNNNFLYVATKEIGLIAYDVSAGILQPVDTIANDSFDNLKITNVTQSGTNLFVSLGGFQGNSDAGIGIISITNPDQLNYVNHAILPGFSKGVADILVQDNMAYLACMEDGVALVNIQDYDNPILLYTIVPDANYPVLPGLFSVPHARGIDLENDILYICNDAGGLHIYDVSIASSPVLLAQYVNEYILDNAARAYNNIVVAHPYAYIGVDYCGIEKIDISTPSSPLFVDHLNFWDCNPSNWQDGDGHVNELLLINETTLAVSAGDSELILVDISVDEQFGPYNVIGSLQDSTATWGVASSNQFIANFNVDNSFAHLFYPQPFYAENGGVSLYTWNDTNTSIHEVQDHISVFYNQASRNITFQNFHVAQDIASLQVKNVLGQTLSHEITHQGNRVLIQLLSAVPDIILISIADNNGVVFSKKVYTH